MNTLHAATNRKPRKTSKSASRLPLLSQGNSFTAANHHVQTYAAATYPFRRRRSVTQVIKVQAAPIGRRPRVAKNQGTTSAQGLGSSGLSHGKLRRFTDTQRTASSTTHAAVKAT
jgi:hypothetical protein